MEQQPKDSVPEEEKETSTAEEVESESRDEENGDGIDWKAEYEKMKGLESKAVAALKEKKRQLKELKSSESRQEESREETGEKEDDIEELLERKLNEREQSRMKEDIESALERLVSNEDERKVVEAVYYSRITPSGFSNSAIERDILDARLIANRSKYLAEAQRKAKEEMAQGEAMRSSSQPSGGKPGKQDASRFSGAEKSLIAQYEERAKKLK